MIPLTVIMCNELSHRSSDMLFAEWNHSVETLFLD